MATTTQTSKPRKRPLTDAERKERADRAAARWAAALNRATNGQSMANYTTIFHGFMAMGIDEADIRPRENVFTWGAWKAKGRQPKYGERKNAVTVHTRRPLFGKIEQRDGSKKNGMIGTAATTAKVYHESQTEPIAA